MDHYAPINGISIERHAELGAHLDGITDEAEQIKKVNDLGVSTDDWQAAQQGWLARMQDMSLMGQVATRYMQLLNEAKSRIGGVASCDLQGFIAISAAIQVFGYEAAMAQFEVTGGDWTQISSHWQTELMKDPMNLGAHKNQMQEQEAQRLRGGGQPPNVVISKAPAGSAAPGTAPQASGGGSFAQAAAAPGQAAWGMQQQQAAMAQAASVMNQPVVQGAMGISNKMAGMMGMQRDAFAAGAQVLVQWSDGNKYPGTVMQAGAGQAMVVFPDGRQMWLEHRHLSKA